MQAAIISERRKLAMMREEEVPPPTAYRFRDDWSLTGNFLDVLNQGLEEIIINIPRKQEKKGELS